VNIQPLAQQVLDQLERRTKLGEDTYISLKVGAPEWMTEFVQDAHGDDYRYEFIQEALQALVDHGGVEDARESLEPDLYTGKLSHWLASNLARHEYTDRVIEYGAPSNTSLLLMAAQLEEKHETFDLVVEALQKRTGDDDGSET
jgi:hypothetical protein